MLDLCSLQYYLYFHYTYLLGYGHVQVREQLAGVGLLLPCRPQIWKKVPFSAAVSCHSYLRL